MIFARTNISAPESWQPYVVLEDGLYSVVVVRSSRARCDGLATGPSLGTPLGVGLVWLGQLTTHCPLLSLSESAWQEALSEAEFEPVACLHSIGEVTH